MRREHLRRNSRVIWITCAAAALTAVAAAGAYAYTERKPARDPRQQDLARYGNALPPAKRSALIKGIERRQSQLATATSSATVALPSPVTESGTRSAGIDDTQHDGPFAASGFSVSNVYQGPVRGRWLVVYAGSLDPNGKAIGAVRVYAGPEDISQGMANTKVNETTFAGSSDVAVTSVNGTVLTLTDTASRATLTFDLAAL